MLSYRIALAVLTLSCVAWYIGLAIRYYHPRIGLDEEAQKSIRFVSVPIIIVMSLILAMMLFTARKGYDAHEALLEDVTAGIVMVDRSLVLYGPTAEHAREGFRTWVKSVLADPDLILNAKPHKPQEWAKEIVLLPAKDGFTAAVKQRLIDTLGDIGNDVFKLSATADQWVYPPTIFIAVAMVMIVFAVAGLAAPIGNIIVMIFGFLSASSIAAIVFLVVEYSTPSKGYIQLSKKPLELVAKFIGG